MKYIIDEKELKKLMYCYHSDPFNEAVQDFLKDKKPVEMIASGKVTMPWENIIVYPEASIEKMEKYLGKNIEIYIKEL